MAYVAGVTTGEIGDPVTDGILVEGDDLTLHDLTLSLLAGSEGSDAAVAVSPLTIRNTSRLPTM